MAGASQQEERLSFLLGLYIQIHNQFTITINYKKRHFLFVLSLFNNQCCPSTLCKFHNESVLFFLHKGAQKTWLKTKAKVVRSKNAINLCNKVSFMGTLALASGTLCCTLPWGQAGKLLGLVL